MTALDDLSDADARAALERACGAPRWIAEMMQARPFGSDEAVLRAADAIWATMSNGEILEAFAHHPRIGANLDALRAKFGASTHSEREQAGVEGAPDEVLRALRDANERYHAKFGHVFLVCATGKTAAEMLAILEARMPNDPETELRIAAAEHAKITRLRLEKL
jgi:2-oxo-4-hydroxy-4-carboxy-5-ureidoimidazoline decarboxylase